MKNSSASRTGAGQKGQGLSEYAIILVGIAIICLAIVVIFGGKIAALLGFAGEEVATMGDAEFGGFADPLDGGDHPDSGGGGSDGADSSGDPSGGSSGGGGDGWADPGGGGSGGRSGGGRGRSGSGRGSANTDGSGGDERLVQPSERPQRGTYTMGDGDREVTVVAARDSAGGRGGRGSAAYDKRREEDSQARTRAADQERWQQRRRERMEEEEAEKAASNRGVGALGMVRFLLIGVLVVGLAFVGRTVLAGAGGGKGGGGD